MDATALRSYRVLDRGDGRRWSAVLDPILRDTHGVDKSSKLQLDLIDDLVSQLVDELDRHRLPEFVIYVDPVSHRFSRLAFLSALVAYRAERLIQAAELTAAALDAMVEGSLQASAVSARALFELGLVCWDIHPQLLDSWHEVHGSQNRIRAESSSGKAKVYRLLWETRMGSRFYDPEDGWPLATNILTRLKRFAMEVPDARTTYDMLCDTTHPNLEAQALLWRTDYITVGEDRAIRFPADPTPWSSCTSSNLSASVSCSSCLSRGICGGSQPTSPMRAT